MIDLGDAPDATAVAELLRQRWIKDPAIGLSVDGDLRDERPRLEVTIDRPAGRRRPAERIQLSVMHLRGADPGEAWPDLVDATDMLVGQLAESDFAYRDLPTGSDVIFGDGVYLVEVVTTRPELEAAADRWLEQN